MQPAQPSTSGAAPRFFEDLHAGMTFRSGDVSVTTQDIIRFAREFDPQPFHTDPAAAPDSFFGAHVASGWHTAALTMRLLVDSGLNVANGIIGAGGEIRWPAALPAESTIHVESEILGTRESKSRGDVGLVTVRSRTLTERGTLVQELTTTLVAVRKDATVSPER